MLPSIVRRLQRLGWAYGYLLFIIPLNTSLQLLFRNAKKLHYSGVFFLITTSLCTTYES